MSKKGTTAGAAAAMKSKAGTARHGAGHKNLSNGARSPGKPTSGGKTQPLKGPDRSGV